MGIRIEKIDVRRGGPLVDDFKFDPADLNLVYGYNETGKTYVVEAIIQALFIANSRSRAYWSLQFLSVPI